MHITVHSVILHSYLLVSAPHRAQVCRSCLGVLGFVPMVSPAGHFHKQVLPFEPPWWFQQVARDPLFVWTDLTEKDLQSLRQFGLGSPNSAAILQKAATQSLSRTDSQQGIELDLYVQTLRQGKVLPERMVQ